MRLKKLVQWTPIINFDFDEEEYLNKHVLALNGLLDY
jgi:hypothetical protein